VSAATASAAGRLPATADDRDVQVDDSTREARATADDAAARADVRIGEVHAPDEMRELAQLFDQVWGRDADAGTILAPEALTALAHAGAQVTAARRGPELVGATAAFLGRAPDGELYLHSHVTGVVAAAAGHGVGRALKWHQRAWALERGIARVRWTFDPAIRRNAVLNLVHLGAQVSGYAEDVYGPMQDARNVGLPTDRLVVDWTLTAPRVLAAARGRAAAPDVAALQRAGAEVLLEAADDVPVHHEVSGPRQLVQVPVDVEGLRQQDPALARRWSDALRSTLGARLRDGWRVSGCSRDGWYVLSAERRTEELAVRP
jgi:predicted GNAT superfamily acetyltransferase